MSSIETRYRYIRELREKHKGDRAVILSKGPSMGVWWSRGGCGEERQSCVVMAVNETVQLPGLAPEYWFWAGPEDSIHVEAHGGVPPGTTQVFTAMEAPRMRTYPNCMQRLLTEPQNRDLRYKANNRTIRETIERFDLDVTFHHRLLTQEEIAEARAQYAFE
jgi:hypothetical protein